LIVFPREPGAISGCVSHDSKGLRHHVNRCSFSRNFKWLNNKQHALAAPIATLSQHSFYKLLTRPTLEPAFDGYYGFCETVRDGRGHLETKPVAGQCEAYVVAASFAQIPVIQRRVLNRPKAEVPSVRTDRRCTTPSGSSSKASKSRQRGRVCTPTCSSRPRRRRLRGTSAIRRAPNGCPLLSCKSPLAPSGQLRNAEGAAVAEATRGWLRVAPNKGMLGQVARQ
jgi:hypothetical protein